MSKFKVGNKVRRVKDLGSIFDSSFSYVITGFAPDGCFSLQGLGSYWDDRCFDLIIDNHWSIYSNTKPLSELTDEQAAELTNYWRRGDPIERKDKTIGWRFAVETMLSRHEIYRAKQKTGRELFIDAVNAAFSNTTLVTEPYAEMLFDAGFKAPKVGE